MGIFTKANSYCQLIMATIFVLGGSLASYAQCPTVTNPTQSFCDIDAPTISNLSALNNGNGVRWYATSTSTTPLSNGIGLVNGEDYYADDNSGTCGTRQRVDVIIYGPPTGLSFQGVCVDDPNDATIADLIANGNDLQWYSVASGGTALATTTILADNTIYYVNQSNPVTGCRTSRLSVFVNVGVVPVPVGEPIQEFCSNLQPPPTVADLQASGNINWYLTVSSASPLDPSTPLIDGQSYFATTIDPPCESIERLEVLVVFTIPPDPGTSGTINLCETDIGMIMNVNLFEALGGMPDTSGTWTGPFPTSNGSLGTLNVSSLTVSGSPYIFTYSVSSISCGIINSTVTVAVIPPPNAGTNGTLDLCENDAPIDLFGSLGGTPDAGGTWSPVLSSGTGLFDPSVDAAGTYTYTVAGITPCADASATVTLTINPLPDAGTNGSLSICENDAAVDLFNSLGGTPDAGGSWSPALASGTGLFDPTVDAAGTYTYTVTGIPPCGDASATVTVIINPIPVAGTNGTLDICENDAPIDLFGSLGGTPDAGGTWSPALVSGTGLFDPTVDAAGTYTYTVTGIPPCENASATVIVTINPLPDAGSNGSLSICENDAAVDLFNSLGGTPEAGGIWTPALASGTGLFDPSVDAAGTYTYTVTGIPPCGDASATVTVIINPIPVAGTNGTLDLCENDAPVDLFGSLGGTPDAGGTWSPALASGTGLFDPSVDAAGTYTYTVSGIPPCENASSTVTVTINPIPNAGTNGSLDICENDTAVDLFNSLGGTPEAGGIWTPALASGTGLFDPTLDAAGTYTYTVTGIPPCGDVSATVTVTINPIPNAGMNGSLNICGNDAPVDLFGSLGGSPDAGGTWSPTLASGTGLFDPTVDTTGTYTYTVTGIPPCGDASATVIVTINPIPDPGTNGSLSICESDAPVDLFDSLGGTPEAGGTWSPALASGTGLFDPTMDDAGTYTYTITGIPPCGDVSATVTVTLNPIPDAGTDGSLNICGNDAPTDLIGSLGGTPDAGGTWSPTLASGTGLFDPTLDTAGTYTYTVTGIPPCGDASATVTVTINPIPNAGTNGSLSICIYDAPVDLFESLGGTPEATGTWSPALASGSGFFDPSVDAAGTYTYTVTGIPPCADASATVTVIINPIPDAGTDGTLDICGNDAPVDLFGSLGGTPDAGGTWSPVLASGTGLFDPSVDAAGLYTYTLSGPSFCGMDSATVMVSIIPPPDISGLTILVDSVCLNDPSEVTISGANQLADGQYSFTYTLSDANTSQTTVIVTIINGMATFEIPGSLLANPGITTITISGLVSETTSCGADVTSIPVVTFNVIQDPSPELLNGGNSFCLEDQPTISDLSSNIIGQNPVIWYDSLENGTPFSDSDLLLDGTTYFASTFIEGGCDNSIRLAVTVSIESCEILELVIPDGFSPNGDAINDNFLIKNLSTLYPDFKLQIYNRYGNILYEGDINTPNWNGTSNKGREMGSSLLPVGVYFYILELNDTTNRTIQGRVYLSR